MDLTPGSIAEWLSLADGVGTKAILIAVILLLVRVVYMLWTRYEVLLDRVVSALESSSNSIREIIAEIKDRS